MTQRPIPFVDDEPPFHDLLPACFLKQDYGASSAGTATEAKVAQSAVNLMILDVILADADQLEVPENLKRIRPDCSMIVMTGISRDSSPLCAAKQNGAAGFVRQIPPLRQFLQEVETILALQ